VILAQVGCWIPAEACRLTPVDRIFTRVGASDKIMQGQSTFLVELSETSVILKNATARSLVILDELGRGTSTFDGTAIAHAVIKYLAHSVDCLALFSTHYHMLIDEVNNNAQRFDVIPVALASTSLPLWLWLTRSLLPGCMSCVLFMQFKDDPRIAMYHMACKVEEGASDVTFLYKFVRGAASKSHAANVARAAGLPLSIITRAATMSETFERKCVEAMGHNRTQLSIAFPQQKPGAAPSELVLPRATREALQNAIARKEWTTVLKLKQQFELAQQQYAKADQQEQKQHGMQTG